MNSCMIGAAWSLNSSMATQKFCWIVCNRALIFLPNTCTSILVDTWSIAKAWFIKFQFCTSRGHKIDSLFSQNSYANVVDLVVVIMLSFKPSNSMHYLLSYGRLKFGWWMMICSIHLMYDAICLTNAWFLIHDVYATCTYAYF